MNRPTRIVAAGAAAALLTACGGPTDVAALADRPELPVTETVTETATEDEPASVPGPELNDRGNIVKAYGEEGGFLDPNSGEPVITFAVDESTVDPACTADYNTDPPEHGHFLAVQMRVSTAPELATSELGSYFTISASDFLFVGPDGLTVSDLGTFPAFSCLDEGLFTNNPLLPGSQYAGTIVLDVPAPDGTLIYRPLGTGGGNGWEWEV